MFCGEAQVGHTVKRVRSCGVDVDFVERCDGRLKPERQFNPPALANPVALHGAHLFRPAVELVEIGQQLIGVVGDFEEPLGNFPPFDDGA